MARHSLTERHRDRVLIRPVTDPFQRRMCVDAVFIAVAHRRTTTLHADTPLIGWNPISPRTVDTPAITDYRDISATRIGL